MSILLRAEDISISFGGIKAVSGVSLAVERGEILSIIGPNGAGKTTFFNIISGLYLPSQGRVMLKDEDVTGRPPEMLARRGLCRTFQNLQVFFGMSALENVMAGRHRHERTSALSHILGLRCVGRENARSAAEAREKLDFVGLADLAERSAGGLSYGALKRLEIARALASEPELLLLDEPAAGCNGTETAQISEIIRKIAGAGITVVLVEHDMKLVMRISDRILVLEQGRSLCLGPPSVVRGDSRVQAAYLGQHGTREAHVA
ncbi:ABC transporter ATP-binding protein [Xanthobacter tagetidis]|jgi:branched-chain amino acid transport system ATP-binding protein|uniref:ABC transporter ATP-binding protein n=1 Tax=Xanthobacter tagetidis TaxID=60216 RepID=A0A3L7A321_9HYPH|nr:ABC transporter ATP-binding protein [Xanthobacter tagetidis]MBB6307160.1 branched-chain amino acid transport system ATP-binding protein [Xanthobacter tagetidis]RLP74001.1 ABC transporter ATP-binding protein [Xanthobacter tagetidis]